MERALAVVRAANRITALVAGVAVLACAAFILAEIVLRQLGASFGGSDEVSGYVMAAITVWGFAYALTEHAHVRIDVARAALPRLARALLDVAAFAALAAVAVVVAWRAFPVLSRSIENGSRANTPLETPLWIPQAIWFAGLIWFAAVASLLAAIALWRLLTGRFEAAALGMTGGAEGDDRAQS